MFGFRVVEPGNQEAAELLKRRVPSYLSLKDIAVAYVGVLFMSVIFVIFGIIGLVAGQAPIWFGIISVCMGVALPGWALWVRHRRNEHWFAYVNTLQTFIAQQAIVEVSSQLQEQWQNAVMRAGYAPGGVFAQQDSLRAAFARHFTELRDINQRLADGMSLEMAPGMPADELGDIKAHLDQIAGEYLASGDHRLTTYR